MDYLDADGADRITVELAMAWATLPGRGQHWHAMRLGAVRGFAQYLHEVDPRVELPAADLLPDKSGRAVPYLYTDAQIGALIEAARTLRIAHKTATFQTLFGVLAATGMRIGEAISLDRSDFDTDAGALTVRNAKFGKSRELPLHPTTTSALTGELRRRGRSVWFDEYELVLGDSLRQKIGDGLANSRVGVVILSPSFFGKRWTKWELDGLTARHIAGEVNVILPVWHEVGVDDVRAYSPPLADLVAVESTGGLGPVADGVERVLDRLAAVTSRELRSGSDLRERQPVARAAPRPGRAGVDHPALARRLAGELEESSSGIGIGRARGWGLRLGIRGPYPTLDL